MSWKEYCGRWCIFTSAGDNNSIRMWLEGGVSRRWDLIVAYYGDNERELAELRRVSNYAFRTKGGKFPNLKKFVAQQPSFFEKYSYIWVCDDDMRMSVAQINEAFAITELLGFWIAQPAFHPEGNNFHTINVYAGSQCDYRTVNYIENSVPIFRQDKLAEFLAIYDGSLPSGAGIDFWYMNVFGANKLGRWNLFASLIRPSELGRFAVIDKVQVINPHTKEKKGGREIERLQPWSLQKAAWDEARKKYGFVNFSHRTFISRKIGDKAGSVVTRYDVVKLIAAALVRRLRWLKARSLNVLFGH